MKLFKLQLELTNPNEVGFASFLQCNGASISIWETNEVTPNGYKEYLLIGTKEILIEFLTGFYDEDEAFFSLYAKQI